MYEFLKRLLLASIIVLPSVGGAAHAGRLEIEQDAPLWAHIGAALLLYLHIGGGTVGLITGITALVAEKGAFIHRSAGKIFVAAMFVAYLIAAGVAPFLEEGQRPNFVAGILALYLLVTGVLSARTHVVNTGAGRWTGLIVAIAITTIGAVFMAMGMASESGSVDGSPPEAFYVFILGGGLAAYGEINVLLRRQLTDTNRIIRHLWRMCFSFFIASGSLFFGQSQVFPDWFNQTPLPALFAFLPIGILLVWATRARLGYFRQ